MTNKLKAEYKVRESMPKKPIVVGRGTSVHRISVAEAKSLVKSLDTAIKKAA